jgi:hypothetical protein
MTTMTRNRTSSRWHKPTPEQRVAANLAKGKAAKDAARQARATAEAASASPDEIEAVTRAASEAVMRRPLEDFLQVDPSRTR